jgi:hypothetical protein
MKLRKMFLMVSVVLLLVSSSSVVTAADFDWMPNFNIQAQADPSGFRAKIATRFNIGDAQITAVLSNFPKPADAYVALRLGEISGKPIDYVTERYKEGKGRGWGAMAKSLGIKPGSKEFHALKRGNDLYDKKDKKGKGKGKKNK